MTAAATPVSDHLSLDSIVLGPIDVPARSVFAFPQGLPGFESHRRFALVPAARDGLFWLQSLADRHIAFLAADPFAVVDGYDVELSTMERDALHLERPDDALLLSIVSLPEQAEATMNLRAPVMLNVASRLGRQIVLADDRYDVRTPVDLERYQPR